MVSESGTGVVLPWEGAAIRGEEMPQGLSYPEAILFLQLRMLYAQKRMGILTREQAIREKKELLREFEVYRYRERMGEEWTQVIQATELARAEFRKNPSIPNGWKLVHIIEGRKNNDSIQ